ncbi:SufE family protein [Caviibacterium pharyngocola]|uniref:Fe-S metabolism associated domain-containing protein n=1 Tax=Caviibacterium pharyngocola TaxID=28159 RepID=A0A2M8RUY5_9PAST|nr:SufE family protein [Caviibacterium pharyngocola]PJG82669.1 hypothetical protein CVP04_07645 [Caviibacterium pharyngocola]
MKTALQQARSWEERYRIIIQAGKNISRPTDQQLSEMQLIPGCEAKLWFQFTRKNDRTFTFQAYSEARIINGLLWFLLQEINGKTAEELHNFNIIDYFTQLNIAQRLSTTRLNGLRQIGGILESL